jgi:hypothetical protein
VRVPLRVALIATLVLVAAGCDDPKPAPPTLGGTTAATPSSTPSATPSTSSGPTASVPSASGTPVSTVDRVAGQRGIQTFLAAVNEAADAKTDAPLKGTWQQSCIWCATVIQPIQMAAFAKGWRLTPARVSKSRITYWKPGITGQLLYRVTMSVSAMKLVDDQGRSQRSSAAVSAGSFSFATQKVGGRWQVVQGIQGDIVVPAP